MSLTVPLQNALAGLASRLGRITSSGRYILEIDGLRFVAISIVFFQHVQQVIVAHIGPKNSATWDIVSKNTELVTAGVELFFIISGFIIGLPFAEYYLNKGQPINLKAYYLRRLTRLEPPYLITLTAFFLLHIFVMQRSASDLFPHFIASAFYVHNIVYRQFSTINSVAWSLEIEIQFYIIAPLLAKLFTLNTRWVRRLSMIGFTLVIMIARQVVQRTFHLPVLYTLDLELPYFMAGFLLADIYISDWHQTPPNKLVWDVVAFVSIMATIALFWTSIPGRTITVSTLLFVFVYASFSGVVVKRFLRLLWVRTIGGMCYSIYLLHFIGIKFIGNQMPTDWYSKRISIDTLVFGLGWGVLIGIASILFFLLIEKPCMQKDWPRKLWSRLTGSNRLSRD